MRETVTLLECNSRFEADATIKLLESFDIPCRAEGDDLGGLGPAQSLIQGVQVIVFAEDEERAREILATDSVS